MVSQSLRSTWPQNFSVDATCALLKISLPQTQSQSELKIDLIRPFTWCNILFTKLTLFIHVQIEVAHLVIQAHEARL